MTKPNHSHSSECASSANPGYTEILNEMSLVMQGMQIESVLASRERPMAYIPKIGPWYIDDWASFWGETVDSMKKKLVKIKCEPTKFGNTWMIDAAVFWRCLKENPDTKEE